MASQSPWTLENRIYLHVLRTHYPNSSPANQTAMFNHQFSLDLEQKKVIGEYSGRSSGRQRNDGSKPSRNQMWDTEVCRDEFGYQNPFNARQQAQRWTALQNIRATIRALGLQNENGLGQVELVNRMEHADPTARAAASSNGQQGPSNNSLGSSGPATVGGTMGNSTAAPSGSTAVPVAGSAQSTASGPLLSGAQPSALPLASGAIVNPLQMVHYNDIQWSHPSGSTTRDKPESGTVWSEDSPNYYIDQTAPIYQLGGPVHLINFDPPPDDNRAVMVCRRDYCTACKPSPPGIALPIQLPGETNGLPYVHSQDLRPVRNVDGLWRFHVAEYRKYDHKVTVPNFKRMVRLPDDVVREVRVCDISCMACNLGD